jgi:hypothetical protein
MATSASECDRCNAFNNSGTVTPISRRPIDRKAINAMTELHQKNSALDVVSGILAVSRQFKQIRLQAFAVISHADITPWMLCLQIEIEALTPETDSQIERPR